MGLGNYCSYGPLQGVLELEDHLMVGYVQLLPTLPKNWAFEIADQTKLFFNLKLSFIQIEALKPG